MEQVKHEKTVHGLQLAQNIC